MAQNGTPELALRRWWNRAKEFSGTNRGRITIIGLVLVVTLTFDYNLAQRHGFFDLNVYHGAINYWVHGGGSLYDFLSPQTTYGFTYPPFAALVMLPMALLAFNPTIWLSCIACVVATVALVQILLDPLVRSQGWIRWHCVLLMKGLLV